MRLVYRGATAGFISAALIWQGEFWGDLWRSRFGRKPRVILREVLTELKPRAPRHPVALRVAFHDPCHLQHAQGLREQPRAMLRTIPGVELLELPESALCCGSAGLYGLVQSETAHQLGERKAANIVVTPAQAVATGNPGCQLQIKALLNEKGHPLPVVHYIELLDASISGTTRL